MQNVKDIVTVIFICSLSAIPVTAAESVATQIPTMTAVKPNEAFVSTSVTIEGAGLKTSGLTFKLGSQVLPIIRQEDSLVLVRIPKGAKSGRIQMRYNESTHKLRTRLVIRKSPEIKKYPGRIPSTGTFQIFGKHLDAVKKWMLGKMELTVLKQKKNNVTLSVENLPEKDAPVSMVLNDGSILNPVPAITVNIVKKPVVEVVGYSAVATPKKTFRIVIAGKNFKQDTSIRIEGKLVEMPALKRDDTVIVFQFKGKLPRRSWKLQLSNGDVTSEVFRVNGKAEGMQLTTREIQKALQSAPLVLSKDTVMMEYTMTMERINDTMKSVASLSPNTTSAAAADRGKQTSVILDAMKRLRVVQGSLCQSMKAGKEAASDNSEQGKQLEEVTETLQKLSSDGLMMLWKGTPADVLKKYHKKLQVVPSANAMNDLVASRFLPWRACRGKTYGEETKSAEDLVRRELEHNLWNAFLALHQDLMAQMTHRKQYEKQVKKMLKGLRGESRDFWPKKLLSTYDKKHAE